MRRVKTVVQDDQYCMMSSSIILNPSCPLFLLQHLNLEGWTSCITSGSIPQIQFNVKWLGFLPCSFPFWTTWVWAGGSRPICSWGSRQSRRRPFVAAAPPTGSDRLETNREGEQVRDFFGLCLRNNAERNTTVVCFIHLTPRCREVGHEWVSVVWLTVDVHQDADVGLSHGVENQTGDGLGEEGVVRLGGEHALPGALQHHATFSPPKDFRETHLHTLRKTWDTSGRHQSKDGGVLFYKTNQKAKLWLSL